ncbi:hypothetical protein PR202_ga26687 [Eleusine coracana subsp. coracana]|uniref:F-box domain-containing protein n=1 Tax=Eleusine coracana subsp. coracana TaxID=191504 RepID=A0AAV5DEH0_ELECO|nr:hypothetical protein PR202_ga26687 [Eleusine coracana subsp. coracana]
MLKSPLKSMESKPAQFCPDEDRISKLPDDIVIAILEKVDVSTAIRTSTLSTRWRHLPLLLSHICLKTEDFMPQNSTPVSDDKVIDEAMAALVELLTSFVAAPRRERCIRILSLAVHLIPDRLCDIGKLVCDAIDCGKLKSLELEFNTVNGVYDSTELDMRRHAQSLMCFFDSSPRVFCCLTKLYLCNANFRGTDMHRLLTSCEQLQDLTLVECDTGCLGVFKIDVPGSKLRVLRVLVSSPGIPYQFWLNNVGKINESYRLGAGAGGAEPDRTGGAAGVANGAGAGGVPMAGTGAPGTRAVTRDVKSAIFARAAALIKSILAASFAAFSGLRTLGTSTSSSFMQKARRSLCFLLLSQR